MHGQMMPSVKTTRAPPQKAVLGSLLAYRSTDNS